VAEEEVGGFGLGVCQEFLVGFAFLEQKDIRRCFSKTTDVNKPEN
jgi:hypothetical protein